MSDLKQSITKWYPQQTIATPLTQKDINTIRTNLLRISTLTQRFGKV